MTDAAELVKLAVAEALWRHETADLRAAKAVRDQMKFCDIAETARQKWLGFAGAALAAQQGDEDRFVAAMMDKAECPACNYGGFWPPQEEAIRRIYRLAHNRYEQ